MLGLEMQIQKTDLPFFLPTTFPLLLTDNNDSYNNDDNNNNTNNNHREEQIKKNACYGGK